MGIGLSHGLNYYSCFQNSQIKTCCREQVNNTSSPLPITNLKLKLGCRNSARNVLLISCSKHLLFLTYVEKCWAEELVSAKVRIWTQLSSFSDWGFWIQKYYLDELSGKEVEMCTILHLRFWASIHPYDLTSYRVPTVFKLRKGERESCSPWNLIFSISTLEIKFVVQSVWIKPPELDGVMQR